MDTKNDRQGLQPKSIVRLAVITSLLLSLPLLAMVFDWRVYDPGNPIPERVNWGPFDFIIMGVLIFGMGLAYEILKQKVGRGANRLVLAIVLFMTFVLIWAELAVGIFGTPFAGS